MGTTPQLVADYKSAVAALYSGNATRPKRVMVADATNGSRVHQMVVTCNDAADNTAKVYLLEPLTLEANMSTGTLVDGGGSADTLTRGGGSFVTDGWKVGDAMFVHGPTTLANEFLTRLTGVAATTLTFATSTVDTGEVLPAGAVLYRAALLGTVSVPDLSGTNGTDPSVDLMSASMFVDVDDAPRRYRTLGPSWALAVAMGTALGAGDYADVAVAYADY